MLTDNLFQETLIKPALESKHDRLQIVSGFATANMAARHLEALMDHEIQASVELIVGMTGLAGLENAQHQAFCELAQQAQNGLDFSCRYVIRSEAPVHAKAYVWWTDAIPQLAYCGSANYTMTGFMRRQKEAVSVADPIAVSSFYDSCLASTVDCNDESVGEHVTLLDSRQTGDERTEDEVNLSFLSSQTGETHQTSGLNWGQRGTRNRNEAYIPIQSEYYDFFPDIGEHFTALTDDEFPLILVRRQQDGKALHTPQSNAILGMYFRRRLGLPSGAFVHKQDLLDYGRTDVTFIKIDDETYFMDFSPPLEQEEVQHE